MKEKYFFSPSTNSFYPNALLESYIEAESLPQDIFPVDDSIFDEFSQVKDGVVRVVNEKGFPKWVEAPESHLHEYKAGKWIISKDNQIKLNAEINERTLQAKKDELHAIEAIITRLERIKARTATEEQELDALIDQSTQLFREIRAEEETA